MNSQEKPNILLIMSDEHNVNVTGCYGNGIVQTPNMDSLAQRGITFDCAYTNSPLCVPCRLSFTAGKYVSRKSRSSTTASNVWRSGSGPLCTA